MLFVCVKNGGKSQMAAGLMRKIAGDPVDVHSAGTNPGRVNALSAESLVEVGVDITGETPKPSTPSCSRCRPGRHPRPRSHVEPVAGTRFENWDTDEPSERGIDGIERCAWSATTSHPGCDCSQSNCVHPRHNQETVG